MGLLSRNAILQAKDGKTKDVDVPEWGGTVRVRTWTVAERNQFHDKSKAEEGLKTSAWLVALLAVDEAGAALFTLEDVIGLEKKSPRALDALVSGIFELNTGGKAAVEDAGKNS